MSEVKEVELLPCGCGRPAGIQEFFIDDGTEKSGPWYVATCSLCPIKTYDQSTPEEATRIWNVCLTRTQPPEQSTGEVETETLTVDARSEIEQLRARELEGEQ